jgi:hypothetical protein
LDWEAGRKVEFKEVEIPKVEGRLLSDVVVGPYSLCRRGLCLRCRGCAEDSRAFKSSMEGSNYHALLVGVDPWPSCIVI